MPIQHDRGRASGKFNKSHAACYAAISMQTGYLACHYFIEFMAGLLSSVMDNEKKSLGFYLSGHPLGEYERYIQKKVSVFASDIAMESAEEGVETGSMEKSLYSFHEKPALMVGLCLEAKKIFTKKSNRPMMFLKLEDISGEFETVVFPDCYEKYASILKEGSRLSIQGKISVDENKASLLAEEIIDLDTAPRTVWIRLKSRDQNLPEVQYIKGICANTVNKQDMVKVYFSESKVTDLVAWSSSKDIMRLLYQKFPKQDVEITI